MIKSEEETCACWDNLQILRAEAWRDFSVVGGTEEMYMQTIIISTKENDDTPIFQTDLQAFRAGRFAGIVEACEHVPTREPKSESNEEGDSNMDLLAEALDTLAPLHKRAKVIEGAAWKVYLTTDHEALEHNEPRTKWLEAYRVWSTLISATRLIREVAR